MAEERIKVDLYRVIYKCDKCEDGTMVPVKGSLLTITEGCPHVCSCGAEKILDQEYPYSLYERTAPWKNKVN